MTEPTDEGPAVCVRLSQRHACVFLAWLVRCEEAGTLPFEHEAERVVVWKVQAELEGQVVGLLHRDWSSRLGQMWDDTVREPL